MAAAIFQTVKFEHACTETLEQLNIELYRLFAEKKIVHDARFLRRMAIAVKHLHFDAKKAGDERVCRFLESSMGPFMENKQSLLNAADIFSEQDPKHSDLACLLEEIAFFGPLFIRAPRALIDP
jgi:hypothetical protein